MNAPFKHADIADLPSEDLHKVITQVIFDAWAADTMTTPRQRVDLNLDRDREILSNGKVREEYRAEVIEGYRLGKFSSAQCCELFDRFLMWPPKTEFFATFFEGVRSFNAREETSNLRVSEDGSW